MKYTLEHVHNVFGSFWVIYDDSDESIQTPVYSTHDAGEAIQVLKELRGE